MPTTTRRTAARRDVQHPDPDSALMFHKLLEATEAAWLLRETVRTLAAENRDLHVELRAAHADLATVGLLLPDTVVAATPTS